LICFYRKTKIRFKTYYLEQGVNMRTLNTIIVGLILIGFLLPRAGHTQTTLEPYVFRYEEVEDANGNKTVERVRYTLSEKKQKDEERISEIMSEIGQYIPPGTQQNIDPRALAEWQYWWEQTKLWEEYIKQRILKDEPLDVSVKDIVFTDPNTLDQQLEQIYKSHVEQVNRMVRKYYNNVISLLGRIEDRIWQRESYRNWVERNKVKLHEFAKEWLRREAGEEIEIEGRVYLVSPKPLKQVPPGKLNIVTTHLTPYDILNEDGTLKTSPVKPKEEKKQKK